MEKLIYATYASSCDRCKEDKFVILMAYESNRIKICSSCLNVILKDLK